MFREKDENLEKGIFFFPILSGGWFCQNSKDYINLADVVGVASVQVSQKSESDSPAYGGKGETGFFSFCR